MFQLKHRALIKILIPSFPNNYIMVSNERNASISFHLIFDNNGSYVLEITVYDVGWIIGEFC